MRSYKRRFRNYLIDKRFQSKYLFLTLLLLLAYTFIFTIILFLPSILTLYFDYPLAEKSEAARTLIVLDGTVWPTIGAVISIFSLLSIFLTHKIAGPVYRLKHALTELTNGNLDSRICLRKWDDLQELAEQVNLFSDELRSYIATLKKDHEELANSIDQLEREMREKTVEAESWGEIIGQIQGQKKVISERLERFKSQF